MKYLTIMLKFLIFGSKRRLNGIITLIKSRVWNKETSGQILDLDVAGNTYLPWEKFKEQGSKATN